MTCLAALAAACSGSSSADSAGIPTTSRASAPGGADNDTGNAGLIPAMSAGGPAAAPSITTLPPETEMKLELGLPQASQNFVYTVNPDAGTVAIIDATTQAIQIVKTGERPTYLQTLEGTDDAIVLNVGSNKATVLRLVDSMPTKTDIPVVSGANAIAVAPDGKHAVIYYNANLASAGNGSGSYQDVSVLVLSSDADAEQAINMTVGFRPRDVSFTRDGKRAFVVTEDGISVLDFATVEKNREGIARLLSFGGSVDQKNLDVAITPDGRYALARAEGKSELHLIDLESGDVRQLDLAEAYTPPPAEADDDAGAPQMLPVVVTDLDLLPSGDAALAVLRNQSAVLEVPLPGAFDDASKVKTTHIEGEVIGSVTVSPDGKSALAYTTATNAERITLLDLTGHADPHTVLLRKAVLAVAFTPDSKTALITHTKLDGLPSEPGLSSDDVIDRSYGYSLLRVATGDVKLQVTRTRLGPIAMVPDGSYLFILFRDDAMGIKEVQRVALSSFLVDPIIQLENPPISIGTVPTGSVFVNLEHPDGRMTFIDWNEPLAKLKTVTGFELNSRIRD